MGPVTYCAISEGAAGVALPPPVVPVAMPKAVPVTPAAVTVLAKQTIARVMAFIAASRKLGNLMLF